MDIPINWEAIGAALDEHTIVSMTDAAGNITYANQYFLDISGYSLPELLGNNHRMLKSGIHSPAFYQQLWETLSGGKTWHGEVCNRHKDGGLYWVRASIKPILDAGGLSVQYISIRTDITDIKQVEEASVRNQTLLRSVIGAIPDPIFFKDGGGKYLGCNEAFERHFGANEAQIIGKTDFDFVDRETASALRATDKRLLASGMPQTREEWLSIPTAEKS